MDAFLCVLSVGPRHLHRQVGLALSQTRDCRVSIASDYCELWAMPREKVLDVAVLDAVASSFELEEACRFIRHRWPMARIILVHPALDFLEDDLYDGRLLPEDLTGMLLQTIERVTRRSGRNITTKE